MINSDDEIRWTILGKWSEILNTVAKLGSGDEPLDKNDKLLVKKVAEACRWYEASVIEDLENIATDSLNRVSKYLKLFRR